MKESRGDLIFNFNETVGEIYKMLANDAVDRKWKKKAVNLMIGLSELQNEIKRGVNVPEEEIHKATRRAEDLLNQLNRY